MFDYDVALSFAGEERVYVDAVANALRLRGLRVFYDRFSSADLWGKNLTMYLTDVYERRAAHCIMFISKSYVSKVWTTLEARAILARSLQQPDDYILPVRVDDVKVPGLLCTVAYVNAADYSPENFADLVMQKTKAGNSASRSLAETREVQAVDEDLPSAILAFLRYYDRWSFNTARIKKWGANQGGFELFQHYSMAKIGSALDHLQSQGLVQTKRSQRGSLLYRIGPKAD